MKESSEIIKKVGQEFYNNAIDGFKLYHNKFGMIPDVVVDIGAHVGSLAIHAALNGSKRVLAIEAEKENFKELENNIRFIRKNKLIDDSQKITSLHFAMYKTNFNQIEIYSSSKENYNSGQNSLYYKPDIQNYFQPQTTETMNLDLLSEFFVSQTINLLKIDIEGAEFDAFPVCERTKEFFKQVEFLDIELHSHSNEDYFDEQKFKEEHSEFKTANFIIEYMEFINSCGFRDNNYVLPNPSGDQRALGAYIKSMNYNMRK